MAGATAPGGGEYTAFGSLANMNCHVKANAASPRRIFRWCPVSGALEGPPHGNAPEALGRARGRRGVREQGAVRLSPPTCRLPPSLLFSPPLHLPPSGELRRATEGAGVAGDRSPPLRTPPGSPQGPCPRGSGGMTSGRTRAARRMPPTGDFSRSSADRATSNTSSAPTPAKGTMVAACSMASLAKPLRSPQRSW